MYFPFSRPICGFSHTGSLSPNRAEATRRKVFDRAIADKALINGYHWGLPGVGKIKKDGNGYAFVPLAV